MTVSFLPPTPWTGRLDDADEHAIRMFHLEGSGPAALMGFACDEGVRRNHGREGARKAPEAIRRALANLSAPKHPLGFKDLGTVKAELDAVEAGQEDLAARIAIALKTYQRVVVLGGGHETAFGSYLGLYSFAPDKKIGIINLDAHFDIREVGDAGATSGTPFTQIRKLNPENFEYLCLGVSEESNTQTLFDRMALWGGRYVSDKDLIYNDQSADQKIDSLIARSDIVYLSIDCDVMPVEQAPGVSAPTARGVPFHSVERIVNYILKSCLTFGVPVPVADIVEVCPPHDQDGRTVNRAAYLARRLLRVP